MRHAEGRGAYINLGGQGPFLEAGARRLPTAAAQERAPGQRSGEMWHSKGVRATFSFHANPRELPSRWMRLQEEEEEEDGADEPPVVRELDEG